MGAGYYGKGAATMIYMIDGIIVSRVGREWEDNMSN